MHRVLHEPGVKRTCVKTWAANHGIHCVNEFGRLSPPGQPRDDLNAKKFGDEEGLGGRMMVKKLPCPQVASLGWRDRRDEYRGVQNGVQRRPSPTNSTASNAVVGRPIRVRLDIKAR